MNRDNASKARKQIGLARKRIASILDEIISNRKPITQGKVNVIFTRCGRAGCKCERGERHTSHFLYVSRGGPLKRIYVPKTDLKKLSERSERYRRYRSLRAELVGVCKQLVAQVDDLERAITEPYEKKGPRR